MSVKSNILATLAYYDVFDFPLKKEEIFKFLVNFNHSSQSKDIASPYKDLRCPEDEIGAELEKLRREGIIGFADGFYFLFDRSYLVPLRLRRQKIARRKWKKALWAAKWLQLLPYLRAVFASGSLAMSSTEELGDLDVLVVVKGGRIWLSRLLISGLLSLIGRRRKYNQKIAPDKICLNHYITDKSLLIPHKSIYTAQTYANLKPLFISDPKIIGEFYKANSWLSEYVLNFNFGGKHFDISKYQSGRNFRRGYLAKFKAAVWEAILNTKVGDWLESWAKRWQTRRIEKHRKQDPPGGRVVYNDEQLEFHPGSVEAEVIKKYNQRLKKLGLEELAVEISSGT